MLSKAKIKYIQTLSKKKVREELSLFIAEGNKIVSDLLPYFQCEILIATSDFLKGIDCQAIKEIIIAEKDEIEKISSQCSAQSAIAVFKKQTYLIDYSEIENSLSIMLDKVQDPGNLGTIIRLADWFGISNIICSEDTVEVYNPKVIQATMGAIARVHVHYVSLKDFLSKTKLPIFGTFLEGENIYSSELPKNGIIIMGNEGNGISKEIEKFVTKKIFIPSFRRKEEGCSESLNVAIATAVVCSEFKRRTFK